MRKGLACVIGGCWLAAVLLLCACGDTATRYQPRPDGDDQTPGGDEWPDGDGDTDGETPAADGDGDPDEADSLPDGDPGEDGDRDDEGPEEEQEAEIPEEESPPCWEEPLDCSGTEPFDYACSMTQPDTCPGGLCVLGLCIGPVLDQQRWEDCGDGCCTPCEEEGRCPADCDAPPTFTGEKEYINDSTLTIWVHGWSNTNPGRVKYGEERGCGGLLNDMRAFGVVRPCAGEAGTNASPQQMAKFEYFGDSPAAWLSPEQIAEIEQYPLGGAQTLHRYALITAIYIRRKLEETGATHVNLTCHSYGCLISRYMMENNLKGLAGENRFVRWFTSAGVIAGARLARLYDNPSVRNVADLFGISQGDFVVMNPDFVTDEVAVWDHRLRAANSPYLGKMRIHHACGHDPRIQQALNIALLDLNNPGDEPNDGIMYTLDTYFHEQREDNRFVTRHGEALLPTRSYVYVDHMAVPETDSSVALAAATLFHGRQVIVTLEEVTLYNDLESVFRLDQPPAEIIVEHQVRYNPYLKDTYGRDVLISESRYDHRTPEMFTLAKGERDRESRLIYSGPVFDDMESLWLKVTLLEVDWYPRFGVRELVGGIGDKHDALVTFAGQVALRDHSFTHTNANARIEISVRVVDLF